jgi:hypothetical protein
MDNFHNIVAIPEKDKIPTDRNTAKTGPERRSIRAQNAWQPGQILTPSGQSLDESIRNLPAATLPEHIRRNRFEIALSIVCDIETTGQAARFACSI